MLHKLSFTLLFALLTCGQIASAQIIVQGKCPAVQFQKDFDWIRFEGVWFEYAKYRDNLEGEMVCVICSYLTKKNNIGVRLSGIDFPNKTVSLVATGKILGPGAYFVTFNNNGPKRTGQILGTDYRSWAVVFSCEEGKNVHTEMVSILTRERNPNTDTVNNAKAVLTQNYYSTYLLYETRQKNCPNHIA